MCRPSRNTPVEDLHDQSGYPHDFVYRHNNTRSEGETKAQELTFDEPDPERVS